MINLNDIIQSAQGGQAIDNLAGRFGLSPQQVQSVINASLPAIEMGMKNASGSGAAGSILAHLGNPANQQSYADPSATTAAPGGSILGSLFGHGNTGAVAQQASNESGVSASVIESMLPVIASIVMGGLFHNAGSGGFGGALSSILGSVMGGGAATPQAGAPQAPAPGEGGGLGGMLGSVLGGLFGGGGQPAAPTPDEAPPPAAGTGASSGSMLDEISNMITAGTPSSADHRSRLSQIIGN